MRVARYGGPTRDQKVYQWIQIYNCNLAYTAAGLNQMFGNNFKKVYFDQDKECAVVLYEFLSVGTFDVTGGQSDIEEMLRTIATA